MQFRLHWGLDKAGLSGRSRECRVNSAAPGGGDTDLGRGERNGRERLLQSGHRGQVWFEGQDCRSTDGASLPASALCAGPTCCPTWPVLSTQDLEGSGWFSYRQRSSSGPAGEKEKPGPQLCKPRLQEHPRDFKIQREKNHPTTLQSQHHHHNNQQGC